MRLGTSCGGAETSDWTLTQGHAALRTALLSNHKLYKSKQQRMKYHLTHLLFKKELKWLTPLLILQWRTAAEMESIQSASFIYLLASPLTVRPPPSRYPQWKTDKLAAGCRVCEREEAEEFLHKVSRCREGQCGSQVAFFLTLRHRSRRGEMGKNGCLGDYTFLLSPTLPSSSSSIPRTPPHPPYLFSLLLSSSSALASLGEQGECGPVVIAAMGLQLCSKKTARPLRLKDTSESHPVSAVP